jgi:hypothetical protein
MLAQLTKVPAGPAILCLLGAVAAGGLDGAGILALETAGGEQRMLFVNGGAAPIPGG